MTNLSDYFPATPFAPTGGTHTYTIINPDAETGDATGWTAVIGTGFEARSAAPVYAGTYSFYAGLQLEAESYQDISAVAGDFTEADIDAGRVQFTLKYAQTSWEGLDRGHTRINFLDEFDVDISVHTDPTINATSPQATWCLREQTVVAPTGTRTIRISMYGYRTGGSGNNAHFDDISLEGRNISDIPGTYYNTSDANVVLSDIVPGIFAYGADGKIGTPIPDYVTAGAVLLFDTQDPTSYPGSGTTITDLSGQGNDITLINSPTYVDNDLVFAGTAHGTYPRTGFVFGTGDRTMCMFVKASGLGAYASTLAYGTGGVTNQTSGLLQNGTTGIFYGWASDETLANAFAVGRWDYHVGVYSGATSAYYLNGVLASGPTARAWNTVDNIGYLCRHADGSSYWQGSVNHGAIYDRALSPAEVLQNFENLRHRKGL